MFSGLEVVVQMTITFLLILLNRTDTPTTGGLETIFDEGKNWWIWSLDANTVLVVSVTWSMFSTIKTHTDLTVLEKGFCSTRSKLVVLSWASFATLRRILSLVTLLSHLWDYAVFFIIGNGSKFPSNLDMRFHKKSPLKTKLVSLG